MDYNSYQGRARHKQLGYEKAITYLPNVLEWVDRVYCFEAETDQYTADQVLGGLNGIDNAPTQALANRTYYLKDKLVRLAEVVSAIQVALSPLLTTIKTLKIQESEVEGYDYQAWLAFEPSEEATELYSEIAGKVPTIKVEFEGGSYVLNPIFELTLENGRTVIIRTDGQSSLVPSVDTYMDQTEG